MMPFIESAQLQNRQRLGKNELVSHLNRLWRIALNFLQYKALKTPSKTKSASPTNRKTGS